MTFVLALVDFRLKQDGDWSTFPRAQNSGKTMKMKDSHRSFVIACAVSSVVEHFLDTEGVRGSNPLSRTIVDEMNLG